MKFKSIRVKTIIFVLVLIVTTLVFEIILARTIFIQGFEQAEVTQSTGDIQRVQGLFQDQINQLAVKDSDWSVWDDAYNFMHDKNQAFIDANLSVSTLSSLQIDLMVFISSKSSVFYAMNYDSKSKGLIPMPIDLNNFLSTPNKVTVITSLAGVTQGILQTKEGPLLFASRPIVKSDGTGPVDGTIFFGRYLDADLLTSIGNLNHSRLFIYPLTGNSKNSELSKAKIGLAASQYFVEPVDTNMVAAFTVVKDFDNKPAFMLEDELGRPIYDEGVSVINNFLVLLGLLSLVSSALAVYMVDNFFIKKITNLNDEVNKAKETGNSSFRLKVKGEDEFASLAISFNGLLDAVEKSQTNFKEQSLILQQKITELEKFKDLTVGREMKMIEIKQKLEELENMKKG